MCKEKQQKTEKQPKTQKQILDNKLWITRKSRINASERLLKAANFIDFINVYFSIFLILLSLISISPYADDSGMLSYVSLAGSITLTISIIYAASLIYLNRTMSESRCFVRFSGSAHRGIVL